MEIRTETVSSQTFWLKDLQKPQNEPIHPEHTAGSAASDESIILYLETQGRCEEIACLHKVDYRRLMECIQDHTEIDLSGCFIDMREWGETMRLLKQDVKRTLKTIKAPYSFWYSYANQQNVPSFTDFEVLHGDVDFHGAVFVSTDFFLKNIGIRQGKVNFENVQGYDSEFILENLYGKEEASVVFNGASLHDSRLQLRDIRQETHIRFTDSVYENTPVEGSGSRNADICLDIERSFLGSVSFPHMSIAELHFPSGNIQLLNCRHSRLTDQFQIDGSIHEFCLEDAVIMGSGRINAVISRVLNVRGIRISGKLYMRGFGSLLLNGNNTVQIDPADLLTLIENFRAVGDYENEDICFRRYKRNMTANESRLGKRITGYLIDGLCGYGTYPFRMLAVIFLMIIGFGLLYFLIPGLRFSSASGLFDCLYVSGITFFTVGYGDIVPLNSLTRLAVVIESCLGVGMMSGFLAVLTHKIIR